MITLSRRQAPTYEASTFLVFRSSGRYRSSGAAHSGIGPGQTDPMRSTMPAGVAATARRRPAAHPSLRRAGPAAMGPAWPADPPGNRLRLPGAGHSGDGDADHVSLPHLLRA